MLCRLVVLLPGNPQLSADFMIMKEESTVPGILKNGNNVAVAVDDSFTTDKRTKGKKETSSTVS